MRPVPLILTALCLAAVGCQSDYQLRQIDAVPREGSGLPNIIAPPRVELPSNTPPPPIDPPPSPWGDLNPGDLPDVHFTVAWSEWPCDDTMDGFDDLGAGGPDLPPDEPHPPAGEGDWDGDGWGGGCYGVNYAVIDLQGQVILEFEIPGYNPWNAWHHELIPAGPGKSIAVFGSWGSDAPDPGDDSGILDGDADGFAQTDPWHAWELDAYTGEVRELARWDYATGRALMVQSGREVNLGDWGELHLGVLPGAPDSLLMWSAQPGCYNSMRDLRLVNTQEALTLDRVFTAEDILGPDLLEDGYALWPWNLDTSTDEEGQDSVLFGVTTDPCNTESPAQFSSLVAWSPDEGALWTKELEGGVWYGMDATYAGWRGGGALTLLQAEDGPAWNVDRPEDSVQGSLPDDLTLFRPGPLLDPAGPTLMVIGRDNETWSHEELRIIHGGSTVWTIDALRFGLQPTEVFLADVVLLQEVSEE